MNKKIFKNPLTNQGVYVIINTTNKERGKLKWKDTKK
jgi:hypothetical protein